MTPTTTGTLATSGTPATALLSNIRDAVDSGDFRNRISANNRRNDSNNSDASNSRDANNSRDFNNSRNALLTLSNSRDAIDSGGMTAITMTPATADANNSGDVSNIRNADSNTPQKQQERHQHCRHQNASDASNIRNASKSRDVNNRNALKAHLSNSKMLSRAGTSETELAQATEGMTAIKMTPATADANNSRDISNIRNAGNNTPQKQQERHQHCRHQNASDASNIRNASKSRDANNRNALNPFLSIKKSGLDILLTGYNNLTLQTY